LPCSDHGRGKGRKNINKGDQTEHASRVQIYDQNSRHGRSDDPGQIHPCAAKGDGIHEVFGGHDIGDEGLPAWHVKGGQSAVHKPDAHEMPEPDEARHVQYGQKQGQEGVAALAHHYDMLSGKPIRERASQHRGEGEGQGKGHHHQGEGERGVIGEAKDEPSPGDLLHAYGQERKEGSQH